MSQFAGMTEIHDFPIQLDNSRMLRTVFEQLCAVLYPSADQHLVNNLQPEITAVKNFASYIFKLKVGNVEETFSFIKRNERFEELREFVKKLSSYLEGVYSHSNVETINNLQINANTMIAIIIVFVTLEVLQLPFECSNSMVIGEVIAKLTTELTHLTLSLHLLANMKSVPLCDLVEGNEPYSLFSRSISNISDIIDDIAEPNAEI